MAENLQEELTLFGQSIHSSPDYLRRHDEPSLFERSQMLVNCRCIEAQSLRKRVAIGIPLFRDNFEDPNLGVEQSGRREVRPGIMIIWEKANTYSR